MGINAEIRKVLIGKYKNSEMEYQGRIRQLKALGLSELTIAKINEQAKASASPVRIIDDYIGMVKISKAQEVESCIARLLA